MLVFSDDKIIYEHIELVYPVCHVLHFVKKNSYSRQFTLFVNKLRLELCLHKNEFLSLYLSYYLTSNIQILVSFLK